MKIIKTVSEMQSWAHRLRMNNDLLGFVPTMGALHQGHLSLVRRARGECDAVVVSIYVNPLQFGPKEDFKRYPRPFAADLALVKKEGVDVVFAPGEKEMFPTGFSTSIEVAGISEPLEGALRPGHFKGVATVVAKLFQIVQPARAYFGEKDFQQVRLISRMAEDLNFPVTVIACPTIRERDGLAMSSRNRYLSAKDRQEAIKLYQALYLGRELVSLKVMNRRKALVQRLTQVLKTIPHGRVDYIDVVDPVTLKPMDRIQRPALLVGAIRVGNTRLIDNLVIP